MANKIDYAEETCYWCSDHARKMKRCQVCQMPQCVECTDEQGCGFCSPQEPTE